MIASAELRRPSMPGDAARLIRSWDKTPGRLQAARVLLVLVCVVAGVVAAYSAYRRVESVDLIANRAQPLNAAAVEAYRSLADADATVAREFLLPEEEKEAARLGYREAIERAAANLAGAGTLVGEEGLSLERITDIAEQLPVYTEQVGVARAGDDLEELREASALMQSTILRQTEALQRDESERLNEQYRQVATLPGAAIAVALVSLVVLGLVQVVLFRRTNRVLNVGLLAATALIMGTFVWWTVAVSASRPELRSSQRRSQSITAALGPAQIAARQARASELLAALAPDPATDDRNFRAKMQIVSRQDGDQAGVGGALGAARRLASDPAALEQVDEAVAETGAWLQAYEGVRERAETDPETAIDLVLNTQAGGTATAFEALETTLSTAIDEQGRAFTRDIDQARGALGGLVVGTGVLALLAAAAASWGIGRRLEEYR